MSVSRSRSAGKVTGKSRLGGGGAIRTDNAIYNIFGDHPDKCQAIRDVGIEARNKASRTAFARRSVVPCEQAADGGRAVEFYTPTWISDMTRRSNEIYARVHISDRHV